MKRKKEFVVSRVKDSISAMESCEKESILKCIEKRGKMAYRKTLNSGIPATSLIGNKIYKTYPDGRREVLGEVKQAKFKLEKKKFSI